MIFNKETSSISYGAVQESPYDLGIGGALMHVWENEQNYNALMKAAALSEMKYYNETGGDLFVQEAGALKGFIEKAKEFFKKIIEKIKSIAHKFMAQINKYALDDSKFVKKYEKELYRRDLTDFEYNGYQFTMDLQDSWVKKEKTPLIDGLSKEGTDDADAINDICERNRASLVGDNSGKMTESEFREELHEKLYGDKEDFKVNIREELKDISETKKLTQDLEKKRKEAVKAIENFIKDLDKGVTGASKVDDAEKKDATLSETRSKAVKYMNNQITVLKAYSNDLTVWFGATAKALADSNRQSKAICVKALSYKHEAATLESASDYSSIFDGVTTV